MRNLKNLYQDANKESGTLSARRASRELGSSLKEEFDFHNITGTLTSFYSNKNITFQFNSYRDEMAFIQDCLCSCLAEMTRTKGKDSHTLDAIQLISVIGGAVAALQEWDVQNALRHHLPPPLSGLVFSNKTNQIPDPTTTLHIKPQQTAPAILTSALKSSTNDMNIISTGKKVTISSDTNLYPRPGSAQLTPNSNTSDNLLFSPLGKSLTINTDFSAMTPHRNKEYGSSIKSPHHAHNTAHPMKRTLTEVILQDESHANYRLQLMEIPSSFFELIAHLCFIEEGKIFCFADGFVRHALDKLTLIHTLLPTNQTNEVIVHYQQYQNQQRQQSKRLIMSASSSVSGSRSSSFLLSSAVKSPKNRLRSPQGTIASTPSSILSNSVPGSFDAEEARRGLKRAESMMSEGKDDDDYYRHIVDFAKHFRASFDQTQPAFHPQSAFTPSAVPRRGTNVTPGVNVIHASNVMNTTLSPDEVFNWIHRKNDIIACLKIIKSIANFHHKHHGSANDIILSTSLYAIAAICKDLIKLHLPREDEVILLAYECLSELAKDTFRFHNPMEENHLLELARQEMSLSIDFPVRGLIAVVNMIRYACQGITSHYIVSMIPLLREPLLRVSRIFPQLSDDIRSANWMLTKSAMIFKSTVDPNYIVSNVQNITVEMEEFFRTGHLHKETEMQVHPNAEINSRLENNHEDRNSALPISSEIKLPSTKHHHTSAGDYTYCGVGSCGSLRFPDAPHNHGEYHHLSEDKRKEILQKLPLLEESLMSSPNQSERAQQYLMPLTKMTAQGKVLRDTLQIAKAKNGFTEIRAVKMNSDKRFTHKVYEDQNNSQGLTSQIRSISVTELPELKLTRPKMPK